MSLNKVKILDTNFAHAKFTTDYQISEHINWVRNEPASNNEIIFMTDNMITNAENVHGKKIAMLMEPRAMNPSIYDWVRVNHNKVDTVLTYDKELLDIGSNIKFYPHCGCWIKSEDQKVYDKTKLLSIIASNKKQTLGHNLRHASIDVAKDNNINIDVFGRGYNPVNYKLEALKDYGFTLVIENSKKDYYFTEKLMDAFMTGTVPIYWGCPSIGEFFNTNGMIIFDDMDTLLIELKTLSLDRYLTMLDAVKENHEKAKQYLIAEDWIYNNTNIFK